MKVHRALLIGVICFGAAAGTWAQEKKSKEPRKEPAVQAEQGMPKPSDEMVKLTKWMTGTWMTTEKHEPNDFVPAGGTGTGKEVIRKGPGGLSLISDYNSSGPMGKFAGHGIIYWDEAQQAFGSFWCDNVNATCEPGGTGKWEGENLVFRGETGMGGKKVQTVQTYTNIKQDSYTFTIDMASPEGEMKRAMTIGYKRAGVLRAMVRLAASMSGRLYRA